MEDVAALQVETPVMTAAVTAAVLYFEHITNCVPRNLI